MKIKSAKSDVAAGTCTLELERINNDVVSVQDKFAGEFMVLFETGDGRPTERIVAGLRQLAAEMEAHLNNIRDARATQKPAEA